MTVLPTEAGVSWFSWKWPRWSMLALGASIAAGCGGISTRFVTGLTAEERGQAETLPFFTSALPPGRYETISEQEGLSCQLTRDDVYEASEENALRELRRATVLAGGDAVMGVSCQVLRRGEHSRSCLRAVVCRGTAVRVTSGQSG